MDVRDWHTEAGLPPAAYVAEEFLFSVEELAAEACGMQPPSWLEAHGPDPLHHPYVGALFLGQDGRGDYIPCRCGGVGRGGRSPAQYRTPAGIQYLLVTYQIPF